MNSYNQPATDNNPMFDTVAHTQGGMPHLMQLLWDEYLRYIGQQLQERSRAGQKVLPMDEAIKKAPAQHFMNFCVSYLTGVRPIEQFAVDMNVGLRMTNHVRCVVCPGTEVQGTMQTSGAVGVTHGMSQPGMGGVVDGSGIPIV